MVSKYFKKICCINKLEQTVIIMPQCVVKIQQLCLNQGNNKAQNVDTQGVGEVSGGCRKTVLGVAKTVQIRIILNYLRQMCTKLAKCRHPSTPCRHPADTPPVELFIVIKGWYKLLIRDRYGLFTKADTLLYFSANVIKKNKYTL